MQGESNVVHKVILDIISHHIYFIITKNTLHHVTYRYSCYYEYNNTIKITTAITAIIYFALSLNNNNLLSAFLTHLFRFFHIKICIIIYQMR